ncbi:calcium-dependent lipid-binding protein-like [Triticum urartu]|uniref:Extended synaptotagmin-2 n=1 Tax=Triticum urartu TaxID=4572 RepID=A0A8R7Q4X1_TRIUA|nr:calcium-dependent lipid-binding protein-like [Triticum urartu]XP_048573588.1 calcium-dependent lipid-binding protein-like [Triticum urartu]XP_048573616.1 calcium-dependent lipid-binding protein-like [Triticum urartu]
MGFFSGIMLGIILGVALIAGWARAMARRAHKRSAKAADVNVLGSLNREDLKKICGENLPQWISFPEYDQVKWLNRQLSKLWPFVEEAATMVIRDSVEPILDVYRPVGISSLKFSRLSLGTVPPKIEGIRVQSFQKGQITMDIDFKWGGDPNIVLAVETLVASLPIQFKNLQVFTIIRVVFQLSDEIPCISAVVIALLAEPKPRIDYILKAVGGSLTAMPGLSDMIDDTVASLITDMLQWPHRIVVPLGVDVDISDLELKPHGKVTVTVVRGESLKNKEFIGKSDPYVVLFIRPMFKERTRVIDDNLNPEWNETFELIAEDKETQHIILEVFDEDSLKQDKRLGIVKLPLSDLEVETVQEINLQLLSSLDTTKVKDKKDRGVLTVRVLYHLYTKEEALRALELEKRTVEERLKTREATGPAVSGSADAARGVAAPSTVTTNVAGTGVAAGAAVTGSGVHKDGSGVHKDGPGVHMVGTGIDAVGKSITKAGKFVGRTVTGPFSSQRRSAASVPTIDE